MTEENTATTVREQLSPEQEALREQAETWLTDAKGVYDAELAELNGASKVPALGRTATHAVAPKITHAPDHIKHGTQIDQEIWKAENVIEEEDDYDAPLTAAERAEEDAQAARDHQIDKIYDALHGADKYDQGLSGDIQIVADGIEPYASEPVDADTLQTVSTRFAQLQSEREKAVEQDQPDPLRDQMAAAYKV